MRFTKRDLKWMFGDNLSGLSDKEARAAGNTLGNIIIGSDFECKTMFDIYAFRNALGLPTPKTPELASIFLRWLRYSDAEACEWIVVEKQGDELKHAIFTHGIRSTPWCAIDEDPHEDQSPDTTAFKARVCEYSEENSCWFDARDLDLIPETQWQSWMMNAPPNANLAISSKNLDPHGVLQWQWMADNDGIEWPVTSQERIQVKPAS